MRYEEYKDINLPWLPVQMPAHWELRRHKNVLSEHRDYIGDRGKQFKMLSLTINGVIIRDTKNGKGKFSKEVDKYVVVSPGDFVFCLFDVDETPRTVGLSKYEGMITGAYDVFTPHDINPEYFYYYYLSLDNVKALKPLYSGLRKVIGFSTFMGMYFPVPPREEQDQIVRYLDWKVSCINKLIHGYQRQIKLLEERRLFIINKAVTKGIKKDTSLKDSGNSWIGAVPSHWDVVPLRRAYTVVLGKMLTPYSTSETDTLEEYLCAKDVHFNDVSIQNLKKMWYSPSEKEQYRVKEGDLLVVEGGAGAGNTAIAKGIGERDIFVQNSVHIIRAKEGISLNSYLNNWMYSLIKRGYMNYICSVATIPHYTKEKVMVTAIPLPPVEEQYAISEYIGEKCNRIDDTIRILEEQIALLKEYRTRLISDVVTGQMDVRGVTVPEYVPEADEEDVELDETLSNADEETEV